ncbi:hypothetical protein IAI18_04685 [Acetobacteraceae bacterium H6797]|nr:hypothetical protein [Acetobacteraceae bacterium H6797]
MATHEKDHPVLDRQEARQGTTVHRMRYVLAISLTLAVIAMVIAYVSF